MAGSARLLVPHLEGSRGYVAVWYVVFLRAPQALGRHRQQARRNQQYCYDFVPVLLSVVRASNAPHWSNNEASASERAWKLTGFFLRNWRTLLVKRRSRLSLLEIGRVDPGQESPCFHRPWYLECAVSKAWTEEVRSAKRLRIHCRSAGFRSSVYWVSGRGRAERRSFRQQDQNRRHYFTHWEYRRL